MTALPAEQEQAVAELIAEQERRRALWTESHGTWSRQIGDVFVTAFRTRLRGRSDWMWMITTPRWSAMSGGECATDRPPSTMRGRPLTTGSRFTEWGMTEYLNRVHHGDCLAVMADLPPACVDLVVTSPPYADARKHDYGGVAPSQYVDWFLPIAVEMKRVLKPSGKALPVEYQRKGDGWGTRHATSCASSVELLNGKRYGLRWVEEYMLA